MLKLAENYHNDNKIIYIIINNNYSHYFTWVKTLLLPSASVSCSSAMALATQMKLPNAMETETTGAWGNKKNAEQS